MAQHEVSLSKNYNLQNLNDHNYVRTCDAIDVGTSGTTSVTNSIQGIATPVMNDNTNIPLSNFTSDNNVNNSLPLQSNSTVDTNSVVMALIE